MGNISSGDEVERAWDVHKDADALFYNHVNAFLLAQTFLVAAFVAVFVADVADIRAQLLSIGICLFALTLTFILWSRLRTNIRRLWFLKHRYLIQDDVYQNYITADGSRETLDLSSRRAIFEQNRFRAHELAHRLPIAATCFWVAALILDLSFFLVGAETK